MKRTAHCPCGGTLRFATDLLGRTVEQCGGCGYEGLVRRVGRLTEPTVPRVRKREPRSFDPRWFSCGHPRSPENIARNRRGWDECRECGRERAKKSRRRLVRDVEPLTPSGIKCYVDPCAVLEIPQLFRVDA